MNATITAPSGAESRQGRLADYRHAHRGETIVVCGCGESLKLLEHPEQHITIGVNDVGRRFTPNYLVVVNPRSQFSAARFSYVERSTCGALFTQIPELGLTHPNIVIFQLGKYGGTDLSDPNVLHYTQNSPYVAVCLAAQMGARRIGLIGVDFTENHFFGPTGIHPLASQLSIIDDQYCHLGEALRARGIEILNLSPISRLTAFPKVDLSCFESNNTSKQSALKIVSYATTPVAGVPLALARCINARTPHQAHCVWESNDYGNGVRFASGIEWTRQAEEAEARLREADVVIVHNGKVDKGHAPLLARKAVVTVAHNYKWNVDCSFVERGFPGVVVAQYQATLAEFAEWHAVPNPIPLWEAAYTPAAKPGVVTIGYTPSGTHERYPLEHPLYWHSKGYETTLRILDGLARRFGIAIETVRGAQVSHAESLAMKRRAHIVIDECVTGSYHRNSLEGLACASVVVNGVGLLPGVADVLRRCVPDARNIPFVYADLSNLEQALVELIGLGPEALTQRGLENRRWLEDHWDFAEQWRVVWEPVIERAQLSCAGPQVRVLKQPDSAVPDSKPTNQSREFRAGVSVVVPHAGSDRLGHLGASLANLAQVSGVSEVIVAEMGVKPCARQLARRWGAKYVFIHNGDVFERARTLNVGAALAEFDLVLWKDNDLLLPASFVDYGAAESRERDLDYLLPYGAIYYLAAQDSQDVIAGVRDPVSCKPAKVLYGGRDVSGGAALVKSTFLLRFGGIPEAFRGWGGEDNAWAHKAALLGRSGVSQRPGQLLFHLHHSGSGAFEGKPSAANPYYAQNVATLGQLRSIRSAQEYVRCFPDTGRRICPWEKSQRIVVLYSESDSVVASAVVSGLCQLYGVDCETLPRSVDDPSVPKLSDAGAMIVIGDHISDELWAHLSLHTLWKRMLVVVSEGVPKPPSKRAPLERAGAVVVPDDAVDALPGAWPILKSKITDPNALAITLAQPLSLVIAGHEIFTTAPDGEAPSDALRLLPVWLYWEGDCPQWIYSCQETIRRHGGDVRLLNREGFERLWNTDRDINLARLHVAHRADFARAFLLARYGGLWIDSDCIVMKSLGSVLELLRDHDFVAHRDRQGYYPNGFIGARRGSVIATEFYRRVCERLRANQPLGWISLGGELLTEVLRATSAKWHELPCESIQPICWSRPETFFEIATEDEHERRFNQEALCYMISNTEVQKFLEKNPKRDLLEERTFFRYLLDRALGTEAKINSRSAGASPLTLAQEARTLLETVVKLMPQRILEVGIGSGRRGLLLRESYGLAANSQLDADQLELVGIISDDAVELAVRDGIYNSLLSLVPTAVAASLGQGWDLVILAQGWHDWPEEVANACLTAALESSAYVLVVGRARSDWFGKTSSQFGRSLISAVPAGDSSGEGCESYLLSRTDPQGIVQQRYIEAIFDGIFRDNDRGRDESVSGPGSCLAQTHEIRKLLPFLLEDLGVRTLLDAPCGDFHWMQHVKLGVDNYFGIDIVKELIARNRHKYGRSNRHFLIGNLASDPLPRADLILCRDCLVHYSYADIFRIIGNLRRSGSTYLLMTTFPGREENQDIQTGGWRPLNLERAPFGLPRPLRIISEKCTERGGIFSDKSLGLWRLFADLP